MGSSVMTQMNIKLHNYVRSIDANVTQPPRKTKLGIAIATCNLLLIMCTIQLYLSVILYSHVADLAFLVLHS